MEIAAIATSSDPRYERALLLRHRVLRAPLGMGFEAVRFEGEETALHVVATEGADVIGSVTFDFGTGRLRAMAVAPEHQKKGVGAVLVERLERELALRCVAVVELHARAEAIGFYEKLGYAVFGEPFIEVTIPHRAMRKTLRRQAT